MQESTKKTLLTITITFVSTLLLVAVVLCILFSKHKMPLSKLHKVISIIESSYVGEYDEQKCEENAINAVLNTIGDDYAVYYNEENAKETMQMIEGYYIGIGVEIRANSENNRIEIISAFEDSPADKAGIKRGDLILSIDGRNYSAKEIPDAVLYIKGSGIENPLDKPLKIVVKRGEEEIELTVKREEIDVYKVTTETVDDICYIRYTGFTKKSKEEAKKIIESLDEKTTKGIVLDIRNNPGGEFNSAIELCDLFLEDATIMYTENKAGDRKYYKAKKGSCKIPMAVLINGSSASASEIFAGAMKDNKRAVLVGEKTYGKGVSQVVRYLNPLDKSEGALKLTVLKNYSPAGKWINESITPDVEVKTEEIAENIREDAAFIAAIKELKKD